MNKEEYRYPCMTVMFSAIFAGVRKHHRFLTIVLYTDSLRIDSLSVKATETPDKVETVTTDAPMPGTIQEMKDVMGDRLIIAGIGNDPKTEKKEPTKIIKL